MQGVARFGTVNGMRILAPWALCLLALPGLIACDKRQGLFITIRRGAVADQIDHVELFLASTDKRLTTTTIGTPVEAAMQPQGAALTPHRIYVRDHDAALNLVDTRLVAAGDAVTFEFQTTATRTLPYAAVVGYHDAGGTSVAVAQAILPKGLAIPMDLVSTVTVDLQPAVLRTQDPRGDLTLWTATSTAGAPGATCAGFGAAGAADQVFLVDATDPDCDGILPPNECDDAYYHRSDPATPCGATVNATSCHLGKSQCSDGTPALACAAGPRCLPRDLCSCPALDAACLADAPQVVATCEVSYLGTTSALCPNPLTVGLAAPGPAVSCAPVLFVRDPTATPSATIIDGPATLTATQSSGACLVAFAPHGTEPGAPTRALAVVDVTAGTGTIQSAAIVEFAYKQVDQCPTDPTIPCSTSGLNMLCK
jgi:hypothetical protein